MILANDFKRQWKDIRTRGEHYPTNIPDQPAMAHVAFELADDCVMTLHSPARG